MTADISHQFGQDIQFSATGDILPASDADYTQQRVLRRLLTAPGATPFHPEYGAGLPAMVGDPANGLKIAGIIRRQMRLEQRVSQVTPPTVGLNVNPNGTVTATITYVDASTGQTSTAAV